MKLSLAALPLRTRPDFETSRGFCGLAQNSAHHVPVRISSPSRLRSRATPYHICKQAIKNISSITYRNNWPAIPRQPARVPPADSRRR
ncbi:hypothetical protein ACFQHW_03020 [Lapidilactobacillus achengensis]|uniref:Uncharacterized protein n=1 Tax=Lapidilactobacillus achengensis TaxID=2486000 RepID=A0ABW1UKR6_9LACO|nr:hypothetical protein [Lapidilactobacillus achengensis]